MRWHVGGGGCLRLGGDVELDMDGGLDLAHLPDDRERREVGYEQYIPGTRHQLLPQDAHSPLLVWACGQSLHQNIALCMRIAQETVSKQCACGGAGGVHLPPH